MNASREMPKYECHKIAELGKQEIGMKVLVINKFGNGVVKDSSVIPRVGDKVDMFYEPLPTVTQVVVWPSKERLAQLQAGSLDIQAIITVA